MKAFRIKDWESRYEDSNTKKIKNLNFVLIPNKMDGLGFRLTSTQKDGADLFAAWILMMEVASHGIPSHRGWLVRDGIALTPKLLSVMTGFKERIFKRAMEFFTSAPARWLEESEVPEHMVSGSDPDKSKDYQDPILNSSELSSSPSGCHPSSSGSHPNQPGNDPDELGPKNRTEGNRTEEKEREEELSPDPIPPDSKSIRAKAPNPLDSSEEHSDELGEPRSRGIPAKAEIFKFAELQGYPTEVAQDFIDYWESEGWTTRNGNTLSGGRWKPRLSKWVRESLAKQSTKNPPKPNGHLTPQMERRAAEYDEPIHVPILNIK